MLKRIYKPYGRCYVDESTGIEYASVTSILSIMEKGGLMPWAKNIALNHQQQCVEAAFKGERLLDWKEIKKEAIKAPDADRDKKGARGTRIHNVIERELNGGNITAELKEDAKLTAIIMQVRKWIKESNLKPLLVEAYLISKKHLYAGAVDLVARQETPEHGKQLILVDFKTGKGVYDTHTWQLAAYANAYHEMYGECPDICFLQHISYDNQMMVEASHIHKAEIPKRFQEFSAIYGAFRARWEKELQ